MKLQTIEKDEFTIIKVEEKRIDAVNAPELRQKINELSGTGQTRVILDISNVTFMDSSGLGVLVSILKMLGGSGELIIAGANGIVSDLFKLTRMDRIFRMCDDPESAEQIMTVA
ncbi:MAG: Anti-sigma factor antagonist [uncultured Thiotrichaceae bacterium]|uniref:Anti-sigma factor antagonist n=1 Tax=uncultured Thiotrichaceae bacterium TaxID=298394 RepID=A0A6S6SD19_9GAMM|nr:MAG: Anti-sigma factor antagonist [uncultured Thiotrichaceae bacterium]